MPRQYAITYNMQTLLYSQIRDIAERVRTNPAIRFWDEDEDGNDEGA